MLAAWRLKVVLPAILLSALVATGWYVTRTSQSDVAIPPQLDLPCGRGGRPILVPITLPDGQTKFFLVDTGAAKTIFDLRLLPTQAVALETTTLRTPAGDVSASVYPCPDARLASLSLTKVDSVAYLDLTPIRRVTGEDVSGILGMDFLRLYALEIDFDRGRVRLWDEDPRWPVDEVIPLAMQDGRPTIELPLAADASEFFALDTGANVSTIRAATFDSLVEQQHLQPAGNATAVTGAGFVQDKKGILKQIRIGNFELMDTRFDRDAMSALGLRHLARFRVRLDPRRGIVSLQPGDRFHASEQFASSGLSIVTLHNEKIVAKIERYGPACQAGISPGDSIVAVNRRSAHRIDMFELGEILTSQTRNAIELEILRGNQRFLAQVSPQGH